MMSATATKLTVVRCLEVDWIASMMDAKDKVHTTQKPSASATCSPSIVAGGNRNLVTGVEDDARREVEARYADQWNAAGLAQRWKLKRQMNAEISELVAKNMPDVSPDALF